MCIYVYMYIYVYIYVYICGKYIYVYILLYVSIYVYFLCVFMHAHQAPMRLPKVVYGTIAVSLLAALMVKAIKNKRQATKNNRKRKKIYEN